MTSPDDIVALPTISVKRSQRDVVQAAFKTIPAYEKWLLGAVRRESMRINNQKLVQRDNQARLQEERDCEATLPPSLVETELTP